MLNEDMATVKLPNNFIMKMPYKSMKISTCLIDYIATTNQLYIMHDYIKIFFSIPNT